MLSDEDLELLGGISLQHIRYIMGAPREHTAGRPGPHERIAPDRIAYDILEKVRKTLAPTMRSDIAYMEIRLWMDELRCQETKAGTQAEWTKWLEEAATRALWLPVETKSYEDLQCLVKDLVEYIRFCRDCYKKNKWGTASLKFLLLHELSQRLEDAACWTLNDREKLCAKKYPSQDINRHLSELAACGIITPKRHRHGQRQNVSYIPGPHLWWDPHHLDEMMKVVSGTEPYDIRSDLAFSLFDTKRFRSLPIGFEEQMVKDIDLCMRQLRWKWLKDWHKDYQTIDKQRNAADQELRDALKECNRITFSQSNQGPQRTGMGRGGSRSPREAESILEKQLRDERRRRDIALDRMKTKWKTTMDRMKELEKELPRFPLVLIDFDALAREPIEPPKNC